MIVYQIISSFVEQPDLQATLPLLLVVSENRPWNEERARLIKHVP
jgi:hypothetical protein